MQFYSDDSQDEFVANLLKFKQGGYFLDIGSGASVGSNNTYVLEKGLGWHGICIEKDPIFADSYIGRSCRFINDDALEINHEKLFSVTGMQEVFDYLSLDIDALSYRALLQLPLDKYRFRVIAIEHDGHFYGDLCRTPQRKILNENGYRLLCADVLNQSGRNIGQEHAWEDWWVDPSFFSQEELNRLQSYRLDTGQIIQKFNQ